MDEFLHVKRCRRAALWAVCVLLCVGCDSLGTTKKFSHPVVPPPPRTRMMSRAAETESNDAEVGGTRAVAGDALSSGESSGDGTSLAAADDSEPEAPPRPKRLPRGTRLTQRTKRADPLPESGDGESTRSAEAGPIEQAADKELESQAGEREQPWEDSTAKPRKSRPTRDPSIQPVSGSKGQPEDLTSLKSTTAIEGAGTKVDKGEVAAVVNGVPIFVDDVLFQYGPGLAQAKSQMPPEEFRRQKAGLVNKHLQPHVEQELLLQALRTKLKDEQLEQIKKHIDAQFDSDLVVTMKKLGVSTRGELETKMKQNGSSIEVLRTAFRNKMLAQQYLSSRAAPKTGFDRPDMLDYYQDNPDKFAIPGRVKWQQIHLIYSRHGGKHGTRKLAAEVMHRLENGEDFAAIAREVSDGATASKGGHWPWTVESSLKSKELDEALFGMPVGEEYAQVEGPDAIDIVFVLDRQEAGQKTFESVQTEIQNELKKAEFTRQVKEVLAELTEKATIERYDLR